MIFPLILNSYSQMNAWIFVIKKIQRINNAHLFSQLSVCLCIYVCACMYDMYSMCVYIYIYIYIWIWIRLWYMSHSIWCIFEFANSFCTCIHWTWHTGEIDVDGSVWRGHGWSGSTLLHLFCPARALGHLPVWNILSGALTRPYLLLPHRWPLTSMKYNYILVLLLVLTTLYINQMSVVFPSVVPMAQIGHAELQDVFEQALLPGGQFAPLSPTDPFILWLPSPALVTTCLTCNASAGLP